MRSSLLSLADACRICDVFHGWLQEIANAGRRCMALANRREQPIASCVRPPRSWNQSRVCPMRKPGPCIYALSRAAGKPEFSGLACRSEGKKGKRADDGRASKDIKGSSVPGQSRATPFSSPKTASRYRLFGLKTQTRSLIRSTTASAPDREP